MPLVGEVMAIKAELLDALHPHPELVTTLTPPDPPVEPTDWLVAESE
jgi:hypothetical protein